MPPTVDRRYFELCLFSQIMQELKSDDLCLAATDYRVAVLAGQQLDSA